MLVLMWSPRFRMISWSALAAVLAMAVAVLQLAPTAAAAPADRAAALDAYLSLADAKRVPAGWTGSVDGCVRGTESAASIEATLSAVNILRDFAGLAPVAFDADLNGKALAAALMMRAANNLSHEPGPGWPCYTAEGDEGAGRSNLYLGDSGAAAVVGYVDDGGVPSLGHRRWVLDPRAGTFGTGSTGTTNALLVIGTPAAQPVVPELVAWPPPGHVPWPLVFGDWSAAITAEGEVDLSGATVSVTVDGQPAATSGVTQLEDGFGTGRTLKWNVGIAAAQRDTDAHVEVTIANVRVDGAPREVSYSFDAFPVLPPAAPQFSATRGADSVTVSWQAASERGVPVTGYRVVGQDGGSASEFDLTLGPDARAVTVPYAQPSRTLYVRVIPLSRAGSPQVTPVVLPAPGASTGDPSSITGTGTFRPGTGGVPVAPPIAPEDDRSVAPARMRVTRIAIRGRRLFITVRLTRRANGQRIRLRLRGGGRTATYRARVRDGRARFSIRLSRRHLRARTLRVAIRYPGGPGVREDSVRFALRR